MSPTYQQRPTLQNARIRTAQDALQVFFAVARNVLTLLTRRLDADERKAIRSGNVYIWEDRSASTVDNGGLTMERWYACCLAGRSLITLTSFHCQDRRNVMGSIAHTRGLLVSFKCYISTTHLESCPSCHATGVSILLPERPSPGTSPQWCRVWIPPHTFSRAQHSPLSRRMSFPLNDSDKLIKQTYSVFVFLPEDRGQEITRKWHLST